MTRHQTHEYTDELGRRRVEYVDEDGKRRLAPVGTDSEVCDFCMGPSPRWAYPAGEVELRQHPELDMSDDAWAACDRCHELIEARDAQALAHHVYETQRDIVADNPRVIMAPRDTVVPAFLDLFARFTAARTGDPYLCR